MALLDYESLNVSRPGSKSFVDGRVVQGTPSTFVVQGNVQPALHNPKDYTLGLEKEGQKVDKVMSFFTVAELRVDDIVTVPRLGTTFVVVKIGDWSAFTTLATFHYQSFGIEVED